MAVLLRPSFSAASAPPVFPGELLMRYHRRADKSIVFAVESCVRFQSRFGRSFYSIFGRFRAELRLAKNPKRIFEMQQISEQLHRSYPSVWSSMSITNQNRTHQIASSTRHLVKVGSLNMNHHNLNLKTNGQLQIILKATKYSINHDRRLIAALFAFFLANSSV